MNLEEEPEGDEDCIDKIHEIEMKNVEFRYPQRSESAVKNINLRILTGEKIAIVGENGSGKTTLLYKPQERRKATGTGGIPPENIRLRRTLTTEYLQLSLCYGVRDRMSIETAGFTGWR